MLSGINHSIIPKIRKSAIGRHFPHRSHNIILIILLAVGLILRLQKLPAVWDLDNARDFLVATHIVKYREFPQTGYYASGINFHYPPHWYYFLAALLTINNDLIFVISLFALVHTLSIITVYQLGRILLNSSSTGLLAAFFFTIASTEIYLSRAIVGNAVIIPVGLLSLLLFVLYLKGLKERYLYGAYILVIISSLMNYSTLVLIFVYTIFTILKFGKFRLVMLLNLNFTVLFALQHIYLLPFFSQFISTYSSLNQLKRG